MNTYCTRTDIESLWNPAAVLTAADDNDDGLLSPAEESLIDDAIERGATQLNASLDMRYTLTELANNAWCRDANASLAAWLLASRKLETPPQSLATLRLFYLEQLAEICAGRLKLPQVPERTESLPAVVDRYPGV